MQQGHVRRRRRRCGGGGGTFEGCCQWRMRIANDRTARFWALRSLLPGAQVPKGGAAGRPARHRQDTAGASGGPRGGRSFFYHYWIRIHPDVCRGRRLGYTGDTPIHPRGWPHTLAAHWRVRGRVLPTTRKDLSSGPWECRRSGLRKGTKFKGRQRSLSRAVSGAGCGASTAIESTRFTRSIISVGRFGRQGTTVVFIPMRDGIKAIAAHDLKPGEVLGEPAIEGAPQGSIFLREQGRPTSSRPRIP